MVKKADEVRELLTKGATRPRIVCAIMWRCRKVDPSDNVKWVGAAITQTAHVLNILPADARALVSEFFVEHLSGDWKKILDNLDI